MLTFLVHRTLTASVRSTLSLMPPLLHLVCLQVETQEAMLKAILAHGMRWAAQHGVRTRCNTVPDNVGELQCDLQCFIEDLAMSGRRVFILLDEVQRFFTVDLRSPELGHVSPASFFKALVSPGIPYHGHASVVFAMTGSRMLDAWMGFSRANANGCALVQTRRIITIPVN